MPKYEMVAVTYALASTDAALAFKVNARASVGGISDLHPDSMASNNENKLSFLKFKNVKSAIINAFYSLKSDEKG